MTTDSRSTPREPSPLMQIGWAVASTAMLAAWLSWRMGWIWALAGVVGVFVHEYGHVLVINALGSGPSRIKIIPFFGGAATLARQPDTQFKGVVIALAGPLFGLLAAIPFFLTRWATDNPQWTGGAYFIAMISLFNLVPAPPLDGAKALGPVLARVHPWLEKAALAIVGAVAALWLLRSGNALIGLFVGVATLGALRSVTLRTPARPLSLLEWMCGIALWLAALTLSCAVMFAAVTRG